MAIAKGVLSEDDFLLQEILFNSRTPKQIEKIIGELERLHQIIDKKDSESMARYLSEIREKIE